MLPMAAHDQSLHDAVRIRIYQHFIETGRAPGTEEIARAQARDATEIEGALVALSDAHTIVLAPGTRSIWMTHPFSAVPTPYRVHGGGISYWANCAWDALGIAAILQLDTECLCRCPGCNQRIDLSVKGGGVSRNGIVHFVVPPRQFWDNVAFT
jgi:hypothetical protein